MCGNESKRKRECVRESKREIVFVFVCVCVVVKVRERVCVDECESGNGA